MAKFVITKGRGSVKHLAKNTAGDTLCGIGSGQTAKAAGPGLARQLCAACKSKSGK